MFDYENMLKKKTRDAERTRQALLTHATRLFAKHGFDGIDLRSVARAAGVNVSLIGHYFGSKKGLYRACLQSFGESRVVALESLLAPPRTLQELRLRLEMAIEEALRHQLEQPDVTQILMRDMTRETKMLSKKLMAGFAEFPLRMARFFSDAQTEGIVRKNIEPLVAAGLLYFAFAALLQVDFMAERSVGLTLKDPAQRKTLIAQTVDILLGGIATQ